MQIEFLCGCSAGDQVSFLCILGTAQCCNNQSLCFTTLEDCAAVNNGENVNFSSKGTELCDTTAIGAVSFFEDGFTDSGTCHLIKFHLEIEHEVFFAIDGFEFVFDCCDTFILQSSECIHAVFFTGDQAGSFHSVADCFFHSSFHIIGSDMESRSLFRTACFFHEFDLSITLFLDDFVSETHGFFQFSFSTFFRFTFDHDHFVRKTGIDQFHCAFFHFLDCRVGNQLTVDFTDTDSTNRAREREIGKAECAGCTEHGQHIAVVFAVSGEEKTANLNFIEETFGEEGADRAVSHTADQNFFVRRSTFAFDVTAGETAGCGEFFTVVDLQREEVLTFFCASGTCCGEHDSVTETYSTSAICEMGEFAGGDGHSSVAADVDCYSCFRHDDASFS